MLTVLAIAQNDIACFLRNKIALFWTFLGPAVCMWFFGFLNPLAPTLASVDVINNQRSQLGRQIVSALRQNGHLVTETASPSGNNLTVEVNGSKIFIHAGPDETEAERSLRSELNAELAARPPSSIKLDAMSPPLVTSGYQRSVPAYLIMFLTMNLLASGATFAQERANGRIKRLLSAPIPAFSVIAGRLTARLVVAWLQMLVLFSIGVFLLHIHGAENGVSIILVLSLYVLAMGSVGMVIGSCFHDPDQASAFAMWGALILAPLTGLWWPIELMPRAFQLFARLIPTGWVMQSVSAMLSSTARISDFPLTIVGLVAVAAIAISISSYRLRVTN